MFAVALNSGSALCSAVPAWATCVPCPFACVCSVCHGLFGYLPGAVLSAKWHTEVNEEGVRAQTCMCVYVGAYGCRV